MSALFYGFTINISVIQYVDMKETCNMRGMLSFLILWMLSRKSMSGQALGRELEKRKGCRPSPGTIYPALKSLKSSGFVSSRKQGKEIVYSLTPKGRRAVKNACVFFVKTFHDVFEESR